MKHALQIAEIFTDGSAIGNPGPGGFGSIVRTAEKEYELKGRVPYTTNNRMEMRAVVEGLKKAHELGANAVTVTSDSQLIINTMTKGWKRKQNLDIWKELDEATDGLIIKWKWVRGHDNHPENERADDIAQKEARRMQEEVALGKHDKAVLVAKKELANGHFSASPHLPF
jgi:ribonuclease HI